MTWPQRAVAVSFLSAAILAGLSESGSYVVQALCVASAVVCIVLCALCLWRCSEDERRS